MKRRGFTWMELIVVLAAVILLAALLVPLVQHRRQQIRRQRSHCQQNIRQMGLAMKQYLSDYNESFPPVSSGGEYYGWADTLYPYVRNTQIFQCSYEDTDPESGDGPKSLNYTDYFYNSRMAGQNEPALQYIANIIMLGDAVPGDARQHSNGGTAKQPGSASLVNRYGVPVGDATRHLDGANYVFADGHVKWLKGSDANTTPAIRNPATPATSAHPTFAIE